MPVQKLQYGMAIQQGAAPGAGNTFRRPLVGQGMMNSDALPQQVPVRRPIVKGKLHGYSSFLLCGYLLGKFNGSCHFLFFSPWVLYYRVSTVDTVVDHSFLYSVLETFSPYSLMSPDSVLCRFNISKYGKCIYDLVL